ncbi:MAG: caspase family protein [Planctomycetes bacterium]|nr:caspase family protein [Planctomycetota bacterium]
MAYIVSVGVNAFDDSSWDLNYAVADAQLTAKSVSERLRKSGQFADVVTVELLSTKKQRSLGDATATKDYVRQVLGALAGRPVDQRLIRLVPGAAKLKEAFPEDLVLISFSTHGYNGTNGRFHLFPSDIGDGDLKKIDDWGISTDDLMLWLRDVDAGEMVMIVDACQSAGTVEQEGFKPGPMGSRGLGQLAYNKRMRILTASESDRPAYEREGLGHGLLTYALVQNGLIEKGAAIDGQITLGGWLKYAEQRVPKLFGKVRKGEVPNAKGETIRQVRPIGGDDEKAERSFQKPSLFDFTRGRTKDVVLVDKAGVK